MNKVLPILLGVLTLGWGGRCDTIHFGNGGVLNGHVVSYGGSGNYGTFEVVFNFTSGEAKKLRAIRRSDIAEIEFNENDINVGAPPPWFTSGNDESSPKDAVGNSITVMPSPRKRSQADPSTEDAENKVLEACDDDTVSSKTDKGGEEKYKGTLISIDEKTGKLTIEIKQESTKPEQKPAKAKKKFIKIKKYVEREKIYTLDVGKCP